jgi:hypothetical protein
MVETIGARLADYALTDRTLRDLVREHLHDVAADPACRTLYRDEVVDQGRRGLRLAS